MGVELPLRVVVTILECCVTFSGVKLSMRSFVLFQGSQIFRIHIFFNLAILFLEDYRFQNSEGLEGLKEYALNNQLFICKRHT